MAAAAPAAAATPSPGSKPALSPFALGVLLLFLAGGSAAMFSVLGGGENLQRAVPGSPSGGGRRQVPSGEIPPGHPSVELTAEMVATLDGLAAEAENAPDSADAWLKLGRARYNAGYLDHAYMAKAGEAFAHVLELDPKNREAWRTQGNIAYEQKDFAKAAEFYSGYLEQDPDNNGVATDLGSALLFQGKVEQALTQYRRVLEREPSFVPAHVNMGIALHGNGQPEEAKKEFDLALSLAKSPDERAQVEQIVAAARGQAPPAQAGTAAGEAQQSPGSATPGPARNAKSNAGTDFQREVDSAFLEVPILGDRVTEIRWTEAATANVLLTEFPMDQMPQVMRNKFKSTLNSALADVAQKNGIDAAEIDITLVDQKSERAMDHLDGREFVELFDEKRYE